MIAFCGLDCAKCDAFKTTASNNDALRIKVADAAPVKPTIEKW